jgi:Ni,Fe-hydrogenase III small subunit
MSNFWFGEGLRKGRKTERFPHAPPEEPPLWPSVLEGSTDTFCPTDAIKDGKWDSGKCISCRLCMPEFRPTGKQDTFLIKKTEPALKKSFYLYKLDTGACGACNIELGTIFDPQYDANRLNIFITSSPRHADAIVVMGIQTEGMKEALKNAYEAMPEPKLIISLGTCAISGGILGDSPMSRDEYHIEIAGCPPSPYTILEAIAKARGE